MLRKRKAGVEDSLADETGTERRERESSEEQAAALMGLMRCFGWLAIVVSVILGVTIFLFGLESPGEWWVDLDCVGGVVRHSSCCWTLLAEEEGFEEGNWIMLILELAKINFVCYNSC